MNSIASKLRRNTNRTFVIDSQILPPCEALGRSLGRYVPEAGTDAEWVLFEHAVWDVRRDRVAVFSRVKQLLPEQLNPELKLLHFSPTLVFVDEPPFHLRCEGREKGQLNHGLAIRGALLELIHRSEALQA